jgi:hypothetical protein
MKTIYVTSAGEGRTIRGAEKKPATMISKAVEGADNITDDKDLFKHLTDRDLRQVFSGLVEGLK